MGRRTYKQQRVARIAHEDNENAYRGHIEYAYRQTLDGEEIDDERNKEQNHDENSVADPEDSGEENADEERDLHHDHVLLAVKLENGPAERGYQNEGIDESTDIEGEAHSVDKHQLETLGHLYKSRNEAVEDQAYDHKRDKKRYERSLACRVSEFLIIYHEDNGRNAEEVQQMDRDRDSDDIGYEHQILVAVGSVGAVFPFQYQPEDQGGAE